MDADSWTLFKKLDSNDLQPTFLQNHPKHWVNDANYQKIKTVVSNLPVINDPAERTLGLVTEYHNSKSAPHSTEEKEKMYFVVHKYRYQQSSVRTSEERCTKTMLNTFEC